jgi:hypothetical protein
VPFTGLKTRYFVTGTLSKRPFGGFDNPTFERMQMLGRGMSHNFQRQLMEFENESLNSELCGLNRATRQQPLPA